MDIVQSLDTYGTFLFAEPYMRAMIRYGGVLEEPSGPIFLHSHPLELDFGPWLRQVPERYKPQVEAIVGDVVASGRHINYDSNGQHRHEVVRYIQSRIIKDIVPVPTPWEEGD